MTHLLRVFERFFKLLAKIVAVSAAIMLGIQTIVFVVTIGALEHISKIFKVKGD